MRPLVVKFPVAKSRVEAAIVKARVELWRCALANARRGDFPLFSFLQTCREDPLLLLSMGRAFKMVGKGWRE